jgi:predicted  nucleic acid-binding Zn-ribbon protein
MHPSIERLLSVQEIDSQMIFLEEAARLRPLEVEDDRKRLAGAQAGLDGVLGRILGARKGIDAAELEVKTLEAGIEKASIALNQAKSNAEYTVFKEQVRRKDEAKGEIEEKTLEAMQRMDGLAEEQKEALSRRDAAARALEGKENQVREVLAGVVEQLHGMNSKREELAESVDKEHLGIYDRVLARYQDFAVARVDGYVCQGCHLSVTPQEKNQLLQGEFLQCRSCIRLLFC